MARVGAAARLLLTVQLVQLLLGRGADFNDTNKALPTGLEFPPSHPNLVKFSEMGIADFTEGLNALPWPSGSSSTCNVKFGPRTFVSVGGHDASFGPPAPPPAQRRLLQEPPPTSYYWPQVGAVQVWTTKDFTQALLIGNPTIIVSADLNLWSAIPLPAITIRVTILGVCSEGSYCKLDAMGKGSIFVIAPGGYLTLKNLDLRNANCYQGGAVLITGAGSVASYQVGRLVAMNVNFYNNTATDAGGAIAVLSGGVAFYSACIFFLNSAPKGGAIYLGAAAPYFVRSAGLTRNTKNVQPALNSSNDTEMTVTANAMPGCSLSSCNSVVDSLFVMNWAYKGGAIYVDDATSGCVPDGIPNGASIDVTSSGFINNSAKSGGAIYMNFTSSGALGQLQNTNFTGNFARESGGDVTMATATHGGPYLYSYQTYFSGTVNSTFEGVNIGQNSQAIFSECTFPLPHNVMLNSYRATVDGIGDIVHPSSANCNGSCSFCPTPEARMQTTAAAISLQFHKKSTHKSTWRNPWTGSLGECPGGGPLSLCGWAPNECMPEPPPPPG